MESFVKKVRRIDKHEKDSAVASLRTLLECAGCAVEWDELEGELRKMTGRALLNLKYRIERVLARETLSWHVGSREQ